MDELRAIARRAGAEIMTFYGEGTASRQKPDATPVTAADELADRLIVAALETLTPEIPIVAEESVAAGRIPSVDGGPFWLVDPLDGTAEFIAQRDEFTVNIALVRGHGPVLGVIHAPAREETYFASGSGGAYRQIGDAAPERIEARARPADGIAAVVSRSHRDAAVDDYLATVAVKSQAPMGSSLKFCLIASGTADLYPCFGATMEWDTAAGQAILEAAGGSVCTCEGAALAYGKPGFANPPFIARGKQG